MTIAGIKIHGGMFYTGTHLPSPRGGDDPALINPALRIGSVPDRSGAGLAYWPGYNSISPQCRAAYLEWLASKRDDPRTPIGYVFLYYYGLERRVLIDGTKPGAARAELGILRAEVDRLLSVYGGNHSFHSYATSFLSFIDLLRGRRSESPPAYSGEKWPIPLGLSLRLGEFGRDRAPVPAYWALAWALFHPEIYPRTPATRCPEEFARLFSARGTRPDSVWVCRSRRTRRA